QKIVLLAQQGATIIALEGLPISVSGYANRQQNEKDFDELLSTLNNSKTISADIKEVATGKGRILIGDNLNSLLSQAAVRKESFIDQGIEFIRKREGSNRTLYFISNKNDKSFEGWLPLLVNAASAVLYDPMTSEF